MALDRGEVVGSLFLDLSKAFESIDHCLLLSKLEAYGVQDSELQWFRVQATDGCGILQHSKLCGPSGSLRGQ